MEAGRRGVLLPDARIALDTHEPGHVSLCSHAHSDHIPYRAPLAHATPATADILAHRAPDLRVERHAYGEEFTVNGARVTFLPAGHVLGSALTRVELDGEVLLYTADFKIREPLTCAPCARGDDVRADVLVIESTFGLPVYQFPDTRAAQRKGVEFAMEVIDEGGVPVFLGYNLGKAHEIIRMLGEDGVPVMAHGAAWNLADVYTAHGVDFPNARAYAKGDVAGHALVAPPSARASPMVTKLKDARVAYCSGWAALEPRRVQMDADLLLPLSDHCDFPDLCKFVEEVRASRVYANHGYSDVLCHILGKRGVDAHALHAGDFHEEEAEA